MAYKRYDAPNHPRWNASAHDSTAGNDTTERTTVEHTATGRAGPRWGVRRRRPQQWAHQFERPCGPETPLVLAREQTGEDTTVELADGPDWIRVTVELPDASLDDVQVFAAGTSIRIRAEPDGLDRTVTLAENADVDDYVVAYRDPVLSVLVPKRDAA